MSQTVLAPPFLYRASLALEEIAVKAKPAGIIASRHSIGKQDFGVLRLVDENWRGSIDGKRIIPITIITIITVKMDTLLVYPKGLFYIYLNINI